MVEINLKGNCIRRKGLLLYQMWGNQIISTAAVGLNIAPLDPYIFTVKELITTASAT